METGAFRKERGMNDKGGADFPSRTARFSNL